MMTTSKPIYVYMQRPDSSEWVTIGKYNASRSNGTGSFRYAPSYLDSDQPLSIDPVNLPLSTHPIPATRYEGLHDVLRDACPDAWGRLLIQRQYGLSDQAPHSAYLLHAGNADRWGALSTGISPKPSVSTLSSPRIAQLTMLSQELLAMQERRAPVDAALRRRLMATPSMGGARPKATVRDGEQYWLVKPILASDIRNIPLLEHVTQRWGQEASMQFAHTAYTPSDEKSPLSIMRSLRFDRFGNKRFMVLSAASLLQTEYPGQAGSALWSYPALAATLFQISVPREDVIDLFCRMVFNAVIGNDDDHPRNHAIRYVHKEQRWRLAPAFDVVPNPEFMPRHLSMELCHGSREISRENILRDAKAFGFSNSGEALDLFEALLDRIEETFDVVESLLDDDLKDFMAERLNDGLRRLRN